MAPAGPDQKADRSYLSSAVDSINPWASSRAATPTQDKNRGNRSERDEESRTAQGQAAAAPGDPGDHSITHLYGQSFRTYPSDCPPLNVQWFHAVDVPKWKPQMVGGRQTTAPGTKAAARPKKFSAFSPSDSRAIESKYQKLLEATEDGRDTGTADGRPSATKANADTTFNKGSRAERRDAVSKSGARVAVNEDFLFDVDIEVRELAPVYWLGPVYEVRRGTWFFQEGSTLRPCEENLAAQLEEGYLKLKPWLYPARVRSVSGAKAMTPKASQENLKEGGSATASGPRHGRNLSSSATARQSNPQPQAHRLFGEYMNNMVTYHDSTTAWLSSDTMLSWVTSSVYERFAGGGYMSGVKLVRGYSEPSKIKDKDKDKDKEKDDKGLSMTSEDIPGLDERQQKILKRRSAPPATGGPNDEASHTDEPQENEAESRVGRLQRQLSSLMDREGRNSAETEEEIRKREEQEIQDDYNAQAGETQGRDIEHLVLVTHGIGQLLSLRMDSINFVHDVNVLRKTLKSVYSNSADLRALNSELGTGPGNCKVQVLPVCWRHMLDFPRQRESRGEYDLGDVGTEEDEYPSLDDITIEGVAFARSLISDLALDVLLYQSSYREEISKIVLGECNRISRLFRERNPEFRGKVHVMGHSLGSAILFDILCRQRELRHGEGELRNPLRFWPAQGRQESNKPKEQELALEFDVEDFYCLGSPIGLFQMLKGRTIAARQSPSALPSESPLNPETAGDPFLNASIPSGNEGLSPISGLPASVSSPKIGQLFNIFHPSDPISYRLEPLISSTMASLKPQLLPYTKKGIFGNVAPQGLTGIGAKVGQSVSGLWSSLSAGIANNLLNRSLGLSNEEVARMTANDGTPPNTEVPATQKGLAPGAGTNISAGGVIPDASKMGAKTNERQKQLADSKAAGGQGSTSGNDPTLIDDELETLYSKFQKKRKDLSKDEQTDKPQMDERKARKMRVEESKVRALNHNGRVDYSIQESALDFNPINTLASHMSYWGDEDVNHFVLSQLLSNKSRAQKLEDVGRNR